MKKMLTCAVGKKSFWATVIVAMLVSCQSAFEEVSPQKIVRYVQEQVNDWLGGSDVSVVEHPTSALFAQVQILLHEERIYVERENLGKADLVSQTNPEITRQPSSGDSIAYRGVKSFTFSDGQISDAIWRYIYAAVADSHVEITNVTFKDYEVGVVSDDVRKITQRYEVSYQYFHDGTADAGTVEMKPFYYQLVKGAKVDDTPLINTDDHIGYSTGAVTTATPGGFTSRVLLQLASQYVTVDANKFGKTVLTEAGVPVNAPVAVTDSLGNQIRWMDRFNDPQTATSTIRNMHATNAEWYWYIVKGVYVDSKATKVDEETYLITDHYRYTVAHSSDATRTVTFDLYPRYYQKLEKEVSYTYKVDSTYQKYDADTYSTIIWEGTITRSDGKKWSYAEQVVQEGDIKGRVVYGVSEAKVVKRDDTNFKKENESGVKTNNNWSITTDYRIWRWDRYYANVGNQNLMSNSEIVFVTRTLKFVDPETGWSMETKTFQQQVKVVRDEIAFERNQPQTTTNNGHACTYVGTHFLKVESYLDGVLFRTSESVNPLYRYDSDK